MKNLLLAIMILVFTGCTSTNYYLLSDHPSTDRRITEFRERETGFKKFYKVEPKSIDIKQLEKVAFKTMESVKHTGTRDTVWSDPMETLLIGYGNCNDIAPLVYRKLYEAGVDDRQLFIIQSGTLENIEHMDAGIMINGKLHVVTSWGIKSIGDWFPYSIYYPEYEQYGLEYRPIAAFNLYGRWAISGK